MSERRGSRLGGSTGGLAGVVVAMYLVATPAIADRGTMLAFGEGGNKWPQYAFWNGDVWDDELGTQDIGKEPNFLVIKSCPTRSEMAIGTLDGDKDVNLLFHDGGSWSSPTEVCDDAEFTDPRCFDIAYEQVSGDLMIAYWDKGRGEVSYRIWDGTTLAAEAELVVPDKPLWVKLYAKAGTDQIMFVAQTNGKDLIASYWNGASFTAVTTHETNCGYTDQQVFDFAWEGLSGDGLLVYGEDGENNPRYRTWTGTWSAELQLPSVGKKQRWHKLAADPESDQILFASLDDDKDINANVWDGSSWGANQELESDMKERTERRYDLTFVRGGGTAMIGYAENGTKALRYRTWNGASWSGESTGPDVGDDPIVITAVPGVKMGEVIFLATDNGSDLNSMYWDGTTLTTQEVEGGVTDKAFE
ncbi:MAG: hypothetical protein KJO43_10100, partial [Phycisphaerae bacterium]|nr:hypothetical protein [Phycisphaerae bacterium]